MNPTAYTGTPTRALKCVGRGISLRVNSPFGLARASDQKAAKWSRTWTRATVMHQAEAAGSVDCSACKREYDAAAAWLSPIEFPGCWRVRGRAGGGAFRGSRRGLSRPDSGDRRSARADASTTQAQQKYEELSPGTAVVHPASRPLQAYDQARDRFAARSLLGARRARVNTRMAAVVFVRWGLMSGQTKQCLHACESDEQAQRLQPPEWMHTLQPSFNKTAENRTVGSGVWARLRRCKCSMTFEENCSLVINLGRLLLRRCTSQLGARTDKEKGRGALTLKNASRRRSFSSRHAVEPGLAGADGFSPCAPPACAMGSGELPASDFPAASKVPTRAAMPMQAPAIMGRDRASIWQFERAVISQQQFTWQ